MPNSTQERLPKNTCIHLDELTIYVVLELCPQAFTLLTAWITIGDSDTFVFCMRGHYGMLVGKGYVTRGETFQGMNHREKA